MNLTTIAGNIYNENGIWFSTNQQEVSYPAEGNKAFFGLEENSFWFRHRNTCIISLVKKFSSESVFFDIGGGNGFVSKGLQNAGIETILIEPGLEGCRNAQTRGLKNVVCSTLEDAGFAANSIEACGMFDVVEHIKKDSEFLKYIYSFLKPGGYCFITVPAYRWLWSNEDSDAGHYKRYTKNEITKQLRSSGFKITYATYLFSFLVFPVFLLRSLPSLWKKKSQVNFDRHQNEHTSTGVVKSLVDMLCKIEFNRIKNLKIIPAGSSVLVVAQKPI